MPLEWTHDWAKCPKQKTTCPGDTTCSEFPTSADRIDMARAAYEEYAEADGTELVDFVQDVQMLAREEGLMEEVWVVTHGYKVEGVFATPDLAAQYINQHVCIPHSWFEVTLQKVVG